MEYKKYKLGDICKIFGRIGFRGYTTEDLVSSPANGAISLSPSNIVDGVMDLSKCTYINWEKYEESPEIKIASNDIVIVKTGNSYGRTAIIRNVEHPMTLNPQFVVLKNIQINPVYLSYFLKTDEFQKQVYGIVGGSAIPTLSQENLARLIVRVPNENIQNTIADILDSLEGKIEVNKRINDNLEAMARQLYDYWFVQFDFPNENGKPYKSNGGKMVWNEKLKRNIPNKWNNGILSNIANITMGQSPDGSSYNENGNGTIFYQGSTDFGIRFPSIRKYTTAPSRFAKKGDILMSVRAPVGAMNIANNDCCIGRGLTSLSSKVGSTTHLYYILDDLRMKFENINSAGTTFGALTKDGLYGLPVVVPSVDIIKQFEDICKPIFDKQMCIGEEINALTKQRDELLPLLMNGQATVNYHLSLAHITPTTLAPLCTP